MRWLKTFAHRTESVVTQVSRVSNVIGIIGVGILMLLITADVLGRFLLNSPIKGAVDVNEYVMIIAVFCSVAYCAVVKGHVKVDMLVSRFPERGQAIIDSFTGIVSLVLLSLIVWSASAKLVHSWTRDEVSLTLAIPAWPFRAVFLIGIIMLCLVILTQFVHQVARVVKK